MDRKLILSLSSETTDDEWSGIIETFQSHLHTTDINVRCCQLLQKLNTIYTELADTKHADTLLLLCPSTLTAASAWTGLDHKHKLNVAKVLSHLAVKVLNTASHSLCLSLSELVIAIVSDSSFDNLEKDRLSIAGYVYKTLWNKHSVVNAARAPVETEYIGRVMALRLAIVGSDERHIAKLSNQIAVTVAACSMSESHTDVLRTGMSQLKASIGVSAKRAERSALWNHLLLFVSCLEALHSYDGSKDMQISSELAQHSDLCGRVLAALHSVKLKCVIQPLSVDLKLLVSSCDSCLELQGLSLLLSRAVKLVTSTHQCSHEVRLSWMDLLIAEVILNRRLYTLEEEARRGQCLKRRMRCVTVMLRMSGDAIRDNICDSLLTQMLHADVEVLKLSALDPSEHDSQSTSDIVSDVGRIIQLCAGRAECGDGLLQSIKQLGCSAIALADSTHNLDFKQLVHRPLADLLSKHSAFDEALDSFQLLSDLPKQCWSTMVSDWFKMKKRARLAGVTSFSSRVLGAEVFSEHANKDDVVWLIFREYSEYTIKEAYYEELSAALEALKLQAVSSTHRALYYLCLAEMYVTLGKDIGKAEVYVTDGLAQLMDNISIYCDDLKAQLYTWQYLIRYSEACAMPNVTEALTKSNYQAPVVTFKSESQLQQPLHNAVGLWTALCGDIDNSRLYSEERTARCLDLIVSTFCQSQRFNKAVEVCTLAARLLSTSPSESLLMLQAEALLRLGDLNQATELVNKLYSKSQPAEGVHLLKAKLLVYNNKIDTAVDLYEEILSRQSRTSLESVYVMSACHCALLDLLINCTSVATKNPITYHAWHCQRDHAALFNSMTAFPVNSYCAKIRYLDSILSSYVTLAKVNMSIGCVRETTCFLSAALNLAKLLVLPLRAADIMTCEAKMDCFLDDQVGAEGNLRHVHTILTSRISIVNHLQINDSSEIPQVAVQTTPVRLHRRDLHIVKQSDMFGFDSEDEDNSFSIVQRPGVISDDEDVEYKVPSYGADRARDITASPSLNKGGKFGNNYEVWGPYTHPITCTCNECGEHMLHIAHLNMLAVLCEHNLKSGLTEDALALARKCLDCRKVVGERPSIVGGAASELAGCKLLFVSTILRSLLTLGRHAEMKREWESVRMGPTLARNSMRMSQLTYLTYLPHAIPYHKICSQVSKLDTQLNALQLSEDVVSSPLQPIRTNSRNIPPPSLKAPKKKNRLAGKSMFINLAFDDSDSEDMCAKPLSTKKSGRLAKPTRLNSQRLNSLSRALSPLASGSAKSKGSRKTPMTIFCDDESEGSVRKSTGDKKLQSKRSARTRTKPSMDGDSIDLHQPIRTRQSGSAQPEQMRSVVSPCPDDIAVFPTISERSPLSAEVDDLFLSPSDSAADCDEVEILRGDTATMKSKRTGRKYPAAESMRSSVPSRVPSPPDLLASPTREPVMSLSPSTVSCDELICNLTAIWRSICSNPPYQLYRAVCQSLAVLHFNQSDMWTAAFYLTETQAITFSHKASLIAAKKRHQQSKETSSEQRKPLMEVPTSRSLSQFKTAINSLPTGWVVCNISVVIVPGSTVQQIYVTRLERNQDPVVLLSTQVSDAQDIWREFEAILKDSKESMFVTDKSVWWSKRAEINERMKGLLSSIQQRLGVTLTALIGCYEDKKARLVVEKCLERVTKELDSLELTYNRNFMRMLINGAGHVSEEELVQTFVESYPHLARSSCEKLSDLVTEGVRVNMDTREPVILCLDKNAHSVCWESMPCLIESPVSRMPSVYSVQSYLRVLNKPGTVFTEGISRDKAFYVLNPDNNLSSTLATFKPLLARQIGWKGIVSVKPTPNQYKDGLSSHDLFLFLGHGGGSRYLKGRELCEIDCEAAVMLMGCSSGALDSRGDMESTGLIYDYHIAKCPSILACLWDVTDKDIDRYTKSLLKNWLTTDCGRLLDHIPSARRSCKLPYLVGSAAVIYGLPVSTQSK